MADLEVIQLNTLIYQDVLYVVPSGADNRNDSLKIMSASEQPLAQILALNGLRVDSRDRVRILGACSREAFLDRSSHQLPEDLVEGSIIGGMRYLMSGQGNSLFLSPHIVLNAFTNRK